MHLLVQAKPEPGNIGYCLDCTARRQMSATDAVDGSSTGTRSAITVVIRDWRMSPIGTKRTCPARHIMSVLGGKADIKDAVSDFR